MLRKYICSFVLVAAVLVGEYYKLPNVRRIEQDLYKSGNLYLQTQYCYYYAYGEDAILYWEFQGSISNKIIWKNGGKCDVKKIFTE